MTASILPGAPESDPTVKPALEGLLNVLPVSGWYRLESTAMGFPHGPPGKPSASTADA